MRITIKNVYLKQEYMGYGSRLTSSVKTKETPSLKLDQNGDD